MKLHSIDTGFFKLDGGAMFGIVPKSLWNKFNPANENNLCDWALRCMLVEDGNRLVLVDTGNGDKQDEKFFSHYYLHGNATLESSIRKAGFSMDDVTDVFLTHLHFDHCGGAIKRAGDKLVPAFKNAIYWSNEAHWNWAIHPNDRERASFLKENILPIQESGKLRFIEVPSEKGTVKLVPSGITGNIEVITVNGHTEAMMLPVIRYKDRTIVYVADLMPSVAHIPMAWVAGYDMSPLVTLQEKKSFLDQAVDGDWVLFFEHDPKIECCTLQRTEKGVRTKATFGLSELL